MNPQPEPRSNPLVQHARSACAAMQAGDRNQLRAAAQALARANLGPMQGASQTDRIAPRYVAHTRPASGNADTNHRAIYKDKPPPSHGR
jgi:hypothetical protein